MALPLSLDLRGRTVVVVGGGIVGERRIRAFLGEGADVVLISPTATTALTNWADNGSLTWWRRPYAGAADLSGAHLVHTATGDPIIDAQVVVDAEAGRCWCINASDGTHTPAAMSARVTLDLADGPVTVAVNASNDPCRAVRIRDSLVTHLLSGTVALQRIRPIPQPQIDHPLPPRAPRSTRTPSLEKAS